MSNNNYSDKEDKLEDILHSIKGIIDNHDVSDDLRGGNDLEINQTSQESALHNIDDPTILELHDVAEIDASSADSANFLVSDGVEEKAKNEFKKITDSLSQQKSNKNNAEFLEDKVDQIMKPLIKEWLNNNLPRIVEKVVSEEIKRIIPK